MILFWFALSLFIAIGIFLIPILVFYHLFFGLPSLKLRAKLFRLFMAMKKRGLIEFAD